jgi:uncharacterized repeat protein (TIGR01451 family)
MLNVRTSEDALREVPCTDTLTLSEDALGLFLSAHSKAQRFSDISFKVTFDAEEGDVHIAEGTVTVVNATIPTKTTAQIIVDTTPALPPPHVSEVPKNPVVPAQSQPASAVTAILPTSPINNFSDLKISYLGIGTVKDGVFVTRATFDNDANAAFRFEVKNIGTKTSKNWTYTLALPGDTQYVSETQTALTPGERAVFTVGFEPTSDTKTSVKIGGTIKTDGDANTKNNSFEWSVKVTD